MLKLFAALSSTLQWKAVVSVYYCTLPFLKI